MRMTLIAAIVAGAVPLGARAVPAASSEVGDHVVIRESNLREQPSTSAPKLALVAPGSHVEVLEKPIKKGYAHVKAADGREGFLIHSNLLFALLLEAHDNDETGPPAGLGAQKGCKGKFAHPFANLQECPPTGCATASEKGNGLSNKLKRRKINMSGDPILLGFDDLRELQEQSEHANYPVFVYPEPAERAALKAVRIRNGTLPLREGSFVAVAGFISKERTIRCGSSESVNCAFTDSSTVDADIVCKSTDIHIPLTEERGQDETDAVVVEPIPFRALQKKLKPKLLAGFRDDERKVLVMGQLFYDSIHAPDPAGDSDQPDRFTVWEVHPVERFFVCPKDEECDPEDLLQWEEIG